MHKGTREPVTVQWDKMSKSRGNVVNPDDVIQEYGADTMRLYEMFMGPLEHSAPWQPDGVTGCYKFLQRLHRLFFEDSDAESTSKPRTLAPGEGTDRQRRLLHQTIKAVTERIERLSFNTAISALMILVRDIASAHEPLCREAGAQLCLLISPLAPHLAEQIWSDVLGSSESLTYAPWPTPDPAYLQDEHWVVVLQINGKRRGEIHVPQSVDKNAREAVLALAMADETMRRHLGDKEPRRVIYVPGKLVNAVL